MRRQPITVAIGATALAAVIATAVCWPMIGSQLQFYLQGCDVAHRGWVYVTPSGLQLSPRWRHPHGVVCFDGAALQAQYGETAVVRAKALKIFTKAWLSASSWGTPVPKDATGGAWPDCRDYPVQRDGLSAAACFNDPQAWHDANVACDNGASSCDSGSPGRDGPHITFELDEEPDLTNLDLSEQFHGEKGSRGMRHYLMPNVICPRGNFQPKDVMQDSHYQVHHCPDGKQGRDGVCTVVIKGAPPRPCSDFQH